MSQELTPLTDAEVAALEAALATNAETWEVRRGAHSLSPDEYSVWPVGARGDGDRRIACWIRRPEIADEIALAHNLLPRLLAERRALRAELGRLEWSGAAEHFGGLAVGCPACHQPHFNGRHAPDCSLAAALGRPSPEPRS